MKIKKNEHDKKTENTGKYWSYLPCMPTPSASMCSSSGVAPPVINVRISVKALSLKYVVDMRESKTLTAKAVPHAKG